MSVPNHIAIIPDGNRRWAEAQGLNAWEGHLEGVKRFWEIAHAGVSSGSTHVTFWGGSYDNLKKRSAIEVSFLLQIIADELAKPDVLNQCLEQRARFRVLGEWREFITDAKAAESIEKIERDTAHFTEHALTILFAYDGRREMIAAANKLVSTADKVDAEHVRSALWTGMLPDVDLVIRTGGEPHWSAGFMMWHIANSQFYFTDVLWPDFKELEFKKALEDFERRGRRLGK